MSPGARLSPWFMALVGVMAVWADLHLIHEAGDFSAEVYAPYISMAEVEKEYPQSDEERMFARGAAVYLTCAACHQPNGKGIPGQFPPLAGSDWVVVGGPNRMIRIVLHGLQGPMIVDGLPYNNIMAPLGTLSDEDIAAVLTYVRGNKEWGNNAAPITPEQVAAVRAQTSDRSQPWTADELLRIPDQD